MQTALEDSRQMLRDMEADGLLAKGTADTKPEQLGSFEGLAAEVKKTVLGQDAFCRQCGAGHAPPLCAGHRGRSRPQCDPAVGRSGHRTAFCTGRDRPHHGGAGAFAERPDGGDGLGTLPRPRRGKAVFAGPLRCPARPGRDRGVRALRELPPRLFAHPLRPCGQGQCAFVQPVSGEQRGHFGGSWYSACPRRSEPHRPLRQVPDLLLPQGTGGAGG